MKFRTHTGEFVGGERLQQALDKVAFGLLDEADDVMREGSPAATLLADILTAKALEIEAGLVRGFSAWQRVNAALTGECIAFLPAASGRGICANNGGRDAG